MCRGFQTDSPAVDDIESEERMSQLAKHTSDLFLEVSAQLLRGGYGIRFRAEGESMHPTIRHGELVTVAPAGPADIEADDIVLCRNRRGIVAHRVVRIEPRGQGRDAFVLCGDAPAAGEEDVTPQQVVGRLVSVVRRGRSIDPGSRPTRLARTTSLCVARLKGLKGRLKVWTLGITG